ncbi:hypothetical protein CV093_12790 [Oceanobacillus sp. 143]|nr:hypothetical protein CV093_12790 [Oceanobacillus sp. 143]
MDNHVTKSIDIKKFDIDIRIVPNETEKINENNVFQQILSSLKEVELKNPTLYAVIEQILYHYFFVLYPITPPSKEVRNIVKAITFIGQESLNIHIETNETLEGSVLHYIDEIKMCETLYLSIIEE